MAAPNLKLAESLTELSRLQAQGLRVLRSKQLSRTHRERLLKNGFLEEVFKGWYLPSKPGEPAGSTAAWFAGMRDFVSGYCDARFGRDWHLSPEQSLQLHSAERALPLQMQIWTKEGNNQQVPLPHGCSMFLYRAPRLLPHAPSEDNNGLQLVKLPSALVEASPGFFQQKPLAAQIALGMVRDTGELLSILLDGSHSVVAGRLAGAFREVGLAPLAENILAAMRSAGYVVNESAAFNVPPSALPGGRQQSPYVQRMRLMWQHMREIVLQQFAEPAPGATRPLDIEATLQAVEDRYVTDAYHSLSIEGYKVTPELIERVRSGTWDPEGADQNERNAMAAKGYFDTHVEVKGFIRRMLPRPSPPYALQEALSNWYRALFGPSVKAGLLKPSDLAGWRNDQVYIRGALHVPVSKEAVRDCMPALFELIENEPHPAVRAVLGHFFFVYIHPYMDGNGRLGRFLMNALLTTGGYVWTVIPVELRSQYMFALERASSGHDITDFAAFIAQLVRAQTDAPLTRPR